MKKEDAKFWFRVFLFIFTMATIGLFMLALGLGANIMAASGGAVLFCCALFSILFIWYGEEKAKEGSE